MSIVNAHVTVHGDVQGVFFRASTRHLAESLGLTGWVRNRPEGSVEAVFEGEEADVRSMIDWCHQGPPQAEVERVDVEWQPPSGEFTRFAVR